MNHGGTMAGLRVVRGPSAGKVLAVDREVIVGRESGTDLAVEDDEVSRRHAALRPVPGGIAVRDLGSRNGTFTNDQRIEGEITLTRSGTLRLGETEIAVELEAAAADPDATAARSIPAAPGITTRRPVAAPPPTASREEVPLPEGPATPAMLLRRPFIPLLGIALAALAALAIVLASELDDTDEPAPAEHILSGKLHGALLERTQTSITFGGEAKQKPGGTGSFTGTLRILGNPASGQPVPMTAAAIERFDGGRVDLELSGTLQCLTPDCAKRIVKGSGRAIGKTGEFADAKGKVTISARADSATQGDFTVRGSLTY